MWEKKGRIFEPGGQRTWLASHAALPIAYHLEKDQWRIYFTARDRSNRSNVGFFEIDLKDPRRILRLSERPVLRPGSLGAFDEHGAMGCWLVKRQSRLLLYYTGWNRGVTVPFRNAIGLAVSQDGGESFSRFSRGPILDRSIHEPFSVGTACVREEEGQWRMWYLNCIHWKIENGMPKHYYQICSADSGDGVDWRREGKVAIAFQSSDEYAISRPSVLKEGTLYRMWYSYRGAAYRIGYAESTDGSRWSRRDAAAGIAPSPSGWDSQMIEYPYVFDHGERRWMLYNGNGFGRTGIGLAVQERKAAAEGRVA